jgi:hypothetical protein
MMEPAPASPKKNKIWIWIVLALAAVLLCCLLLVTGTAVFAIWKGYIQIPGISIRNLPVLTSPVAPDQGLGPKTAPPAAPGPLTVEPYQPQAADRYPSLQDLTPNWEGLSAPGTQTWNIKVAADQSTLLFLGWCTTTPSILNDNFDHIQYLVEVDGQPLSMENLHSMDGLSGGQVCRNYVGLIRVWPAGKHVIKITMRLDSKINDGWSDYPAGDYEDIYNITVTP